MKEHLLKFGSVVVYYAPFEKTRIKELAMDFPEYAGFLTSINNRIWDQLDVFKHCFRDHRLALSKSIKVVLPTFVPELSYKDLNVQKGDQAQLEWRNMIELESEALKRNRVADLKAYCKLDTLAMVELHKFIKAIAER
jgi:antitoxin component of MazEF toxin-antitoxin module